MESQSASMQPNSDLDSSREESAQEESEWKWWSSSLPILPQQPVKDLSPASPAAYHTAYSDSYLLNARAPSSNDASPQLWPRSMSFAAPTPAPSTNNADKNNFAPQAPSLKQIRFIPSDGQPHTKRRRITAACLTCRKRKVRCSGERPECNTCTQTHGQSCSGYANETSRKGISGDNDDSNGSDDDRSDSKHSKRDSSNDTKASVRPRPSAGGSGSRLGDVDDGLRSRSPASNQTAASVNSSRHRAIPYFRYFGPTAIVPGFK